MQTDNTNRCINIDWLEVYALEPKERYPMNAEYFRRRGYFVQEREYGTRVYNEMFCIVNEKGDPLVEVRRNPASGDSSFSGLVPESVHLRLPNWVLYQGNPVRFLGDFMIKNDYIFKRIFRIDICLDFEFFDSGDRPDKFVKRYLEGKFRKVNQCSLSSHGEDNWNDFDWNSLSWGSRTSMVSTKLYNKTKELMEGKTDKPYIRTTWMMAGLIDNPLDCTRRMKDGTMQRVNIWRLEYSMKSACDGWIVIETDGNRGKKKQHIPHRLPLFDGKERIWDRFQDLTYHYFRFKYKEYADEKKSATNFALSQVHSDVERPLKRKDRCRDKKLFYFDANHTFTQLSSAPSDSKPRRKDESLERLLRMYMLTHYNVDVRKACEILIKDIDLSRLVNYSPKENWREARALQLTLSRKMNGDPRRVAEILNEILSLLNEEKFF